MATTRDIDRQGADPLAALSFTIEALAELQSSKSSIAAMEATLLTAVLAIAEDLTSDSSSPLSDRATAIRTACAEIGAALRVSDRTVQARLSRSWELSERFPAVLTALAAGQITTAHADAIVAAGVDLPTDDVREKFAALALDRAQQLTPARLRAALPTIAEQLQPTSLTERHQCARKDRRVDVTDLADGMAELRAVIPGILAHGIYDRLTSMARAVEHDGSGGPAGANAPGGANHSDTRDGRARDELRADIFCDLLLGGGPIAHGDGLASISAHVQVTIPVLSVIGEADDAAHLTGSGPLDAQTAREIAGATSTWTRIFTDPINGAVLATDRYRPGKDLRRQLVTRDEHCRFPGCRQPAHHCDVDHSIPASRGGPTHPDNLAHLCRRHHTLKHAAGWKIRHLGEGLLEWTTPTGRTYVDHPSPSVRFVPSDDYDHLPS